jgi:hypothetical protein
VIFRGPAELAGTKETPRRLSRNIRLRQLPRTLQDGNVTSLLGIIAIGFVAGIIARIV